MRPGATSVRALVVLATAGLLVAGCGRQDTDTRAAGHTRPPTASAAPTASPGPVAQPATASKPAPRREPAPVPVENVPTELPPGDPGLDAPSVPDPGKPEHGHDHEHEAPARTAVPRSAMLGAHTVSAVLGGGWRESHAQAPRCASVTGSVADRTVAFSADDGRLVQTVATHTSIPAADRAVDELARRLRGCGWTDLPDPRIGMAASAASSPDGTQTAVVISAEGVTVTLVGAGSATSQRARWSSLQDLTLASSCPAAPLGCH